MKKTIYIAVLCLITAINGIAQNIDDAKANLTKTKADLKEGWTKGGTLNFSINEAGINNDWYEAKKGGEKSFIGIRGIVDYNFDRKKGKSNWLNSFRGRYGMSKTTSTGSKFLKNDDYLNFNSIYGKEFKKSWSYAGYFGLESKFENAFLTPGYIKFGPGFLYKPNAHFSVLMSPLLVEITTKLKPSLKNVEEFGVKAGKTTAFGLGAFVQANANYNLVKGINYKSTTTLYSNYLNKPGNIIFDMNNLFTFTVNKYIGATFLLNARYSDLETKGTQIQHAIGLGFNYKL